MNIKELSYSNTDEQYFNIIKFLKKLNRIDQNLLWDPGRMNFWRHSVHGRKLKNDSFFKENVKIWCDKNEIVGLCISEYGKNDVFIEVHPNYKNTYNDIFRWIDNYWSLKKDVVEIDVFEDDVAKLELLEKYGYKFKCHFENLRYYLLDQINLEYKLEKGYKVQAFFENPNYESRVEIVKSAFNNKEYSKQNLLSIQSSPDYRKELDLCVVAPSNQFVAYCIGWHDISNEYQGYIEPVGTHKLFRRRGFASAVIKECFKRLKSNGIKKVAISSYAEPNVSNYLYDSLNPSLKKKKFKYYKTK